LTCNARGEPILVAGKTGQLARCLAQDARQRGLALVALGRPALDLTDAGSLASAVAAPFIHVSTD
jgi:dTDP-4-dehydrorhamnose reductase